MDIQILWLLGYSFKVIIVLSFPKSSFNENVIFKTHPFAFWVKHLGRLSSKLKSRGP